MNTTDTQPQIINWLPMGAEEPEEGRLVLITGHYMGKPEAGRWVALARLVHHQFFSDETGEELFPPTHWHPLHLPA